MAAGGGRCTICLSAEAEAGGADGGGAVLQRGCCCRGDGGLAHLSCMVQLSVHMESSGDWSGWWECGTCQQVRHALL